MTDSNEPIDETTKLPKPAEQEEEDPGAPADPPTGH
jgi:hypothetical protein